MIPLVPKDAALFAYVALNHGGATARAAALLWPGATERGALNNLRQRLFRLRGKTEARLLEVSTTASLAEDLRLEPMPDLAALEADPHAWDAELLQGIDVDDETELSAWLTAERKAWAERRRDALASIASACEKAGELVRALNHARRLLLDDPLSEHAHRRLMRLHYQRGDTASAVAAFEACEAALKDELGLQPSAETLALLQTIECGRPAIEAAEARPGPVPATLLRPPRAVGRHAERAQLAQAHADGQIAALVGEAGMGKTRLLLDFIAEQRQAVYAQARPGDAAVPYGVLARLLRALVAAAPAALECAPRSELARVAPEWGDVAVACATSQAPRLQAAIEQVMVNALAAGIETLVVDDLHFADQASVEMLRALVDTDALSGVRWAFAHRPIGVTDENGALLQALADSPQARWIVLAPLTDADLVELLDSLALPGIAAAEFAPALARHTGGNPLYVLETLREARLQPVRAGVAAGFALPRPQNIAHMIDRRLQRLSEPALALARVAALAGADFSPELAEHALTTPALLLASAWTELEAADVLRGNAFAHDLVRDGMLRATPQPIAVHAHRLIARYLESRGEQPARIAAHWQAAGEHAQAAEGFRAASAHAHRAARPREKAQFLLQAADAFDRVGNNDDATRARLDAVEPLLLSHDVGAALKLTGALVEANAAGRHAASAWERRAGACLWAGSASEAERAARQALALAERDAESLRVDAVCIAAQACGLQGRAAEGLEMLRGWDERVDHLDDIERRCGISSAYANLLVQADRPVEAFVWTRRHLVYAEQLGDLSQQMTALMDHAAYHLREGGLAAGIVAARRAAAVACGDDQARALASWNQSGLAYMLCVTGQYALGLELLDAELALSQGSPSALRTLQEIFAANVMLVLGQVARARQHLLDDDSSHPNHRRSQRLIVRAALARALGEDDRPLLEQALDSATASGRRYDQLCVEIELVKRIDDAVEVDARCLLLARQASERDYLALKAEAGLARLRALERLQRHDEAAGLAEELEALSHRYRHPSGYFPDALDACATAYKAAGRHDAARRCLADALHWLHAIAIPNVPPYFRESFMRRHPVNHRLEAELARMAEGGLPDLFQRLP